MNRLQVHSKEMPIFYKETTQKLMPTRKVGIIGKSV